VAIFPGRATGLFIPPATGIRGILRFLFPLGLWLSLSFVSAGSIAIPAAEAATPGKWYSIPVIFMQSILDQVSPGVVIGTPFIQAPKSRFTRELWLLKSEFFVY
jgi:hypothetical protein